GIRIDFDFVAGAGYCGIQRRFPMALSPNYKFTFYVKADAPVNNFEFKLLDESGDNVWWVNQRSYEFPQQWQKVTIKKRDIAFAWGPTDDRNLKRIDKIEFIIAAATGGKGSVYLDQLSFEQMAVPDTNPPDPRLTASSNAGDLHLALDDNPATLWRSAITPPGQNLVIDLQKHREYGGLMIDWDELDFARSYTVLSSADRKRWEPIYTVTSGSGGRRYLNLKDGESRYLKLDLMQSSRDQGYAIRDLEIAGVEFSDTPEAFFRRIAPDQPRGFFPKYFLDEQSYWTVVGVNGDTKEALINEEGTVEVDKRSFSIEPFIFFDDKLVTWNEVRLQQQLEKDYLPVPSVYWYHEKFQLQIQAFANGEAERSVLCVSYKLKNIGATAITGSVFLAIRPFQVNPPWQFLNNPGGTTKIKSIRYADQQIWVNEEKTIVPLTSPDGFGAVEFDQGDICEYLSRNQIPPQTEVNDHMSLASAGLRFAFQLHPDEEKTIFVAVPFHATEDVQPIALPNEQIAKLIADRLAETVNFWESKVNRVDFKLPPSGDRLIHTLRSNLAYILINRDGVGIQPGSRSYERSWIRDGALTSSALLKMGLNEEVKEFFSWYATHQYDTGKVPCVVDQRGADPVPEHDSTGEFIFGLLQYFRFTGDTTFLRDHFEQVDNAVVYLESLIAQRSTDYYKNGGDSLRALYGLLPESISHEGYSAKPMHSYWDDFWGYRGLSDAVTIAALLGKHDLAEKLERLTNTFEENLINSIKLATRYKAIDFIPGCVELGDFDATSTTIAVSPCNIYRKLPQPLLQNTFDRYYQFFQQRRDPDSDWVNYTPYELRLVGTFVFLGQPSRSHELLDFFFSHQRPTDWNHWAEVVWRDPKAPKFIGDMPHTWVGSDYINALRALFVYEDESDSSLVIAAGLLPEWIDSPEGVELRQAPTYYGRINYSIKKVGKSYSVGLSGDLRMPEGNIRIKSFKDKAPKKVVVNGKKIKTYDAKEIIVGVFPAEIKVEY
ncbi:MAG TPA: discoidin domain-containing protein, partial [bacterium]